MTTEFSLQDVLGKFFGGASGPAVPSDTTDENTTATTQVSMGTTPVAESFPVAAPKPITQPAAPEAAVAPAVTPAPAPAPVTTHVTAPVSPNYNANIAQAESGGNANIGYHAPGLSTAYGPYGITQGAWTDARKANPALPEDITKATPEQMNQAQNVVTGNNATYLKNYGIPVNEQTLSAAHFIGAKGLSDFQTKKDEQGRPYISPEAAAANGGYDKARSIIEGRLGGAMTPASGALQQPQPTQAAQPTQVGGTPTGQPTPQQQYHTVLNSNSQEQIGKLALDANAPVEVRNAAWDKLYGTQNFNSRMANAKQTITDLGANPDPRALSKALNDKDEGSYVKAIFYGLMGWKGKQQQELDKIDPPVTYGGVTLSNGQSYSVKTNKSTGETIAAWDSEGNKITNAKTLGEIAANGISGFKLESTRQDLSNGHTVSVLKNDKTGQVRYRDDTTGQILATAPQHLGNVGTKSPEALMHDKATASANSAMKPMIDANTRAAAAGGAQRFTEDQIQAAGNQAYSRINPSGKFGGAFTPGQLPTATVAPVAGQAPAATVETPAAAPARPGPVAPTTATVPAKTVAGPSAPKSYAQQVLDGDTPPPSGQSGQRAAIMEQVQKLASEQGKTYDPTIYNVRKKTEEAFTTGKQGDTVKSMNVAIDHLDTLQSAANALNNGRILIFNDIANKFAKNTGQPAPGNFDALKSIVGSEVAKAVAGGATALGDREEIRAEINNTKSPAQLAGVIQKYQQLLGGQLHGLERQYKGGGGQYWDKKIDPRTQEVLGRNTPTGNAPGAPAPYQDTNKEQRYQEWLKNHPEFQGNK